MVALDGHWATRVHDRMQLRPEERTVSALVTVELLLSDSLLKDRGLRVAESCILTILREGVRW